MVGKLKSHILNNTAKFYEVANMLCNQKIKKKKEGADRIGIEYNTPLWVEIFPKGATSSSLIK